MTDQPNRCGSDVASMTSDEVQELAPSYALREKQNAEANPRGDCVPCTCNAALGQAHAPTCPVAKHYMDVTKQAMAERGARRFPPIPPPNPELAKLLRRNCIPEHEWDDYTLQVPVTAEEQLEADALDEPCAAGPQMVNCECGERHAWPRCEKGSVTPNGVMEFNWRSPISIKELEGFRTRLFNESSDLLRRKGNDYNSSQQLAGDTLFNLRVCEILGIVPSPVDGLLVRMSDKFMRLVSLTRPNAQQQVKDESLEDTLKDLWNYGTYALAMLRRAKGQPVE